MLSEQGTQSVTRTHDNIMLSATNFQFTWNEPSRLWHLEHRFLTAAHYCSTIFTNKSCSQHN
jgi:hypothetical protein